MNVHDLHERSLALAAAAIDFDLSHAEATELERHLAACPTCARRASALRTDASALGGPLDLRPSRRVDDAVHAEIAGHRARPERLLLVATAALLLLALLGAIAVGAYLLRIPETLLTSIQPQPTAPVALISPRPDATPSGTPTPSASLAPVVDATWQRIATIQGLSAEDRSRDVAGAEDGYVVIGSTRTIWYSADALTWTSIELPFERSISAFGQTLDANVDAIATNGRQIVIVGAYSREPCARPSGDTGGGPSCPLSPISWISDDGRTWRSSHPWQGPVATPTAQGSEFVAAWSVPNGGWDAALSHWEGESLTGQDVLHSDDGVVWTAMRPLPVPSTAGHQEERNGVADAAAVRVVSQRFYLADEVGGLGGIETWLASSSDGRTWSAVEGFPTAGAGVTASIASQPGGGGPWIFAGTTWGATSGTGTPTIWTTSDLDSWTTTALPASSAPPELCAEQEKAVPCSLITTVDALIEVGDSYLAVGSFLDDGFGYAGAQAWLSRDGVTWIDLGPSAFGQAVIANGPAGLISVGVPDRESAVAVWRLDGLAALP